MRLIVTAFLLLASVLLIPACSTVSHNPTVYEYHYEKESLAQRPVKTLVLASVNVSGEPTRSILRKSEAEIDAKVVDRLEAHGFKMAPQYLFDNAWKQAIYTYGNIYDPTSGKVDVRTWQAVMSSTFQALKGQAGIDAVIFTDLIEHEVQHSAGLNHYARWYGVTRKPATQGAGTGVPADFNWAQPINAASLVITIYDLDGKPLFSSRGGLDTLSAIDMRNPDRGFVRRDKILKSDSNVEEGIQLALHPLVPMKRYPGKDENTDQE